MALSNGHYTAPPPHLASSNRSSQGNGMRHAAVPTYSPPVQAILQIGHEQNLRAAISLGLVAMNGNQPVVGPKAIQMPSLIKLDRETEQCWVAAGRAAQKMDNFARALTCYENALQHNPQNPDALLNVANILRAQEDFGRAADFYMRALAVKDGAGETWGCLGHCYLMTDDLPKAYNCYQQAIVNSVDSKNEPRLWYGIGILYDRYGSLEHAEEAFASVIKMDPDFDKANEIYFRLGIIYKQQKNSQASLQCFQYILNNPPRPLTEIDIWFQIGHVYEQQQEFDLARDAYDRVLAANPNHAKVLQQLGGLYQRKKASFYDPERSISILTKSLEHDSADAFTWYLLGRAYMTADNFGKAYEAYQQAVYRDGKNPAFWCSIGVLYCNINQYHDSLDAYSRAIRINPYISEVWFNLGALYESCNDQMNDAVDAYQRTLQLDPANTVVQGRLDEIRSHQQRGSPLTAPPQPRDISPSSSSWLLASHVNPAGVDVGDQEDPSRPTSHASGHPLSPGAHPATSISSQRMTTDGHANRIPGPDSSRRSANAHHSASPQESRRSAPHPSTGRSFRSSANSSAERPGLPQMRSQSGEHDRVDDTRPRGGSYSANISSYQDSVPPDWIRAKATARGPPMPYPPRVAHDGRSIARSRVNSSPPQHYMHPLVLPSAPLSTASATPPLPSYGGSLPALQLSDRELQERRRAMERADRHFRESVKNTTSGSKLPGESKKGKTKSHGDDDNSYGSRKRAAPAPAPRPPELAHSRPSAGAGVSKLPSDEDNDEGANTLLALAAGAHSLPTDNSVPGKRPISNDMSETISSKRPRGEVHQPVPVSAAS